VFLRASAGYLRGIGSNFDPGLLQKHKNNLLLSIICSFICFSYIVINIKQTVGTYLICFSITHELLDKSPPNLVQSYPHQLKESSKKSMTLPTQTHVPQGHPNFKTQADD